MFFLLFLFFFFFQTTASPLEDCYRGSQSALWRQCWFIQLTSGGEKKSMCKIILHVADLVLTVQMRCETNIRDFFFFFYHCVSA